MGIKRQHRLIFLTALTLIAGVLLPCGEAKVKSGFNRRLTPEERAKAFDSFAQRMKVKMADPFCIPNNSTNTNTTNFPTVPKSFITQMEIAFQYNQTVITGEEMFDGVKNYGVFKYSLVEGIFNLRPQVFQEEIHYSIPDDEALFIYGNNACEDEGKENCHPLKLCIGGDLNDLSEELKNLLGYSDLNPGKGFMGAAEILQWGPSYNYQYVDQLDCRGLRCDVYEACIKLDDTDNRVYIRYFWSAPDWTLNTDKEQVPIAIELSSSGTIDPVTVRPFMLRYDFYDFLRDAQPDGESLQPPVDVYCYGMKDGDSPPKVGPYFAYKSETVSGFEIDVHDDNQTKSIQFTTAISQEEFYDWDQKIATSKFVPRFLFDSEESRYEHTTFRVQDFNQGLEYSIKLNLDNCTVRLIENVTSFDVIVNDDGSIEMMPPWMFDHLDEPLKYTGKHWSRGIESDVWIGTNKNPLIPILNDSYVYYFASPLKPVSGVPTSVKDNFQSYSMAEIPVTFEKYISLFEALPHKLYHVHRFEEEPPLTHTIDISLCYQPEEMIDFMFDFPVDTLNRAFNLKERFAYGTQTALAKVAEVSPIRINRLVLEERSDSLRVLFTILAKPTFEGDVSGADKESTKEEAKAKINQALKKHQLVVNITDVGVLKGSVLNPKSTLDSVTVYPVSTRLTPVNRESTHRYSYVHNRGYNAGSMAGIAIGMLVTGAVVAAIISIALRKHSGRPSGLPRVTVSDSSGVQSGNLSLDGSVLNG